MINRVEIGLECMVPYWGGHWCAYRSAEQRPRGGQSWSCRRAPRHKPLSAPPHSWWEGGGGTWGAGTPLAVAAAVVVAAAAAARVGRG